MKTALYQLLIIRLVHITWMSGGLVDIKEK